MVRRKQSEIVFTSQSRFPPLSRFCFNENLESIGVNGDQLMAIPSTILLQHELARASWSNEKPKNFPQRGLEDKVLQDFPFPTFEIYSHNSIFPCTFMEHTSDGYEKKKNVVYR